MNQFASWKYGIIIITVLMSLVYALPNIYGESPAIQIMPIKSGEKIEPSILSTIEDGLSTKNIINAGIIIDPFTIKIKFLSADDQLAAKSLVQEILGKNYVVALNLISNSPSWLTSIGALPMYLGLDLRGGVHFLMQLDLSKVSEKKSDGLLRDTRKLMRDEKIKYFGKNDCQDSVELAECHLRLLSTAGIQFHNALLNPHFGGGHRVLVFQQKPVARVIVHKARLARRVHNPLLDIANALRVIPFHMNECLVVEVPIIALLVDEIDPFDETQFVPAKDLRNHCFLCPLRRDARDIHGKQVVESIRVVVCVVHHIHLVLLLLYV